MCGLVYKHNEKPSHRIKREVWKQYKRQEHRGTQGFGIFDGKHVVKAATEKRIERWFKRDSKTNLLLFHHRMPTSTENTRRGAHPYHTGDYFGDTRYVLAHNGCIRNPDELKEEHDKLGINYVSLMSDGSFNDSEALLWDFALTMEGKQEEMKAYGDMAIICIKLVDGEPVDLMFGRNNWRPLKIFRQNKSMTLSSEGVGEDVPQNHLFTYNYATGELTNQKMTFAAYAPYSQQYSWESYNVPSYKGFKSRSDRDVYGDDFYYDEFGNIVYEEDDYIESELPLEEFLTQPTDIEIEREYYRVLNEADGSFMDAYWLLQGELYMLEQLMDDEKSDTDIQMHKTLKAVSQMIVDDPDYIDQTSIHPLWLEDYGDYTTTNLLPEGA